ncbi:hypothetical protein PTSG_11728 [Salpingoeca rosetta]|uniref:Phosphofurin acidic cluster sorting protein 1/2 N-terminal C2 domain-containing protein n=1 Tax=Salpingoeca rosetta (strain ATCC 50818 / BSB-021) TaxID=946362 RepID=F2U0B8_SALR5|nr:uncharacterized protein PTSG_11728 [Salpingoeca rosetta]EGD80846.1 hypothetical protein PTSG_11728 [Salpingoeca rosetta]|eukprot:XP_004997407.1 hypothetical protein PTSG_11728 [Salpingoeca rosetta]
MSNTDRGGGPQSASLPMNYFASWEVSNRLNPGWVPRELLLKIDHIKLLQPIDVDSTRQEILKFPTRSIVVAVSAESSRRVLRSSELDLDADNRLDTAVHLSFTLPYAHCLKNDLSNIVTISIQRRKRYKHRPIKGYKTLGTSTINLSQVLQHDFSGQVEMVDKEGRVIGVLGIERAVTTSIEGKTTQDDGADSDDSLEASDIEDEDRARRPQRKPIGQLRKFMARMIHDPMLLSKLKRRRRNRAHPPEGQQPGTEDEDDDDDDDEAEELDEIALLEMLRMGSEVASLYSDESDTDDVPVTNLPYLAPFYGPRTGRRAGAPAAATGAHHRHSLGHAHGLGIGYTSHAQQQQQQHQEPQQQQQQEPQQPQTQQQQPQHTGRSVAAAFSLPFGQRSPAAPAQHAPRTPGRSRNKSEKDAAESPTRAQQLFRAGSLTRQYASPPRHQGLSTSPRVSRSDLPPPAGLVATAPDEISAALERNPDCVVVGCASDRMYTALVQSSSHPLHHALTERGTATEAIVLPDDPSRARACITTLLSTAESMAKDREARSGVRTGLQPAFTCVVVTDGTAIARLLDAMVSTTTRARCPPSFRVVPSDKQDHLCRRIAAVDSEYQLRFGGDDWHMLLSHYSVEAASQDQVLQRLKTYITTATRPLSFEAGQVQVQTDKEGSESLVFLSRVQFGLGDPSDTDLSSSTPRDDLDIELDFKPVPREREDANMTGVKGTIKAVVIERIQDPFTAEQPKHGRLKLHVTRGPPKQKIKRLMTKKELEGNLDVDAEAVLCKPSRGKPKLCLVVDGCIYPDIDQCYITGVHPSTSRRIAIGSFPPASSSSAA